MALQTDKKAIKNKLTALPLIVTPYLLIALHAFYSAPAFAELYFSPALLEGAGEGVADLSRFNHEGVQPAGTYPVDIYVNNQFMTEEKIFFHERDRERKSSAGKSAENSVHDNTGLVACLSREDLASFGIAGSVMSRLKKNHHGCIIPGEYIEGAYMKFNFQKMRLDISIPQAAMEKKARGYIPPERWDDGINAAMLNYTMSGSTNRSASGTTKTHYINLNSGVNWAGWRFRDYRIWNEYSSQHMRYQKWRHLKTYVEHPIIPLHSAVQFGDSMTSSDIFDAVNFRGGQIFTDDSMYPDSQRGFAPVIRGTARTNARVDITQNGYSVYQTFVSPGAFAISDLYPVSSSGDLHVTVTEADGAKQQFTVPYSSLPVLQREGHIKYTFAAGRYHAESDSYSQPDFVQGTLIWGLPRNITLYGGVQYSDNYLAGLVGTGWNMGMLGAISADLTQASSTLMDGRHYSGQSLRFLYARSLNSLGTTFQLMGYRYSTQGFYTLQETARKNLSAARQDNKRGHGNDTADYHFSSDYYDLNENKKSKLQMSISQQVGSVGALFISGVRQTYWNSSYVNDSLQTGFNSTFKKINYSVTYNYNRANARSGADQSLFFSMSVPLGGFSSFANNQTYATLSSSKDSHGNISHQASLSGTALADHAVNWNVTQGLTRDQGNSGSVNVGYQGAFANSNVGYSYSQGYRQTNYGIAGGMILHSGGVTFGQPLGETNILIAAPGMADVAVENEVGIHTDWRGYAIKPYASIYRENRVALDTSALDVGAEIENPVRRVVPTRGAIVRASFKGRTGKSVIIHIQYHGRPVPFGSYAESAESNGIVGDQGQLYLSGVKPEGTILLQWGNAENEQCRLHYRIPEEGNNKISVIKSAVCQ